MSDENFPRCGATWPLDDPGPEDSAAGRTHVCRLLSFHADGYHLCDCGAMETAKAVGYTVESEPDYARTYDEDDVIPVRRGDIRAVLDVATMSMNFASGFLVEEQVEALRKIADVLGIDPLLATPANFVCKYGGSHDWHPMLNYGPPPIQRLASPALDHALEAMETAKAALRAEHNDVNQMAFKWAKQQVIDLRAEHRTNVNLAQEVWKLETRGGAKPMQICPLCHHTRMAPVIWTQTFEGSYVGEVSRLSDDEGALTLYRPLEGGDAEIIAQHRVALELGDEIDGDDDADWVMWCTDRIGVQ